LLITQIWSKSKGVLDQGRRGHDRMVVGLQLPVQSVQITTKAEEFESCSWRATFDATLFYNVCH